jgi:hypothetical protein
LTKHIGKKWRKTSLREEDDVLRVKEVISVETEDVVVSLAEDVIYRGKGHSQLLKDIISEAEDVI